MNLTDAASFTKKFIVVFGIILFIGLVSWVGFLVWQNSRPKNIAGPIPPDYKFGTLPQPLFPESKGSGANYSYSLDTETGSLPKDLPNMTRVYFTPLLGATLLASDYAKELAESLKFSVGPQILSNTTHRFSDNTGGQITINLTTNNFNYEKVVDLNDQSEEILPDAQIIGEQFKSFLASKNLLKSFIQNGRTNVIYDGASPKDSSRATVSVFFDDIDGLKVVTPEFTHGSIKATVTKYKLPENKYPKLDYVYWEPDPLQYATYSIKSIETAFEDLKKDQGVIIIEPKTSQVSIVNAYLAYYISEEYSKYIQPIFVFEGPDFVAYVPAVTSEHLEP